MQFDEFNIAMLSKTPLIDLIAHRQRRLTEVDESLFLRGAVTS